jgi:ABC-2 type transport system permease protein
LRQTPGVSIMPLYLSYVLYEVYITPGLSAMIQLFNGMQSLLSMVYGREVAACACCWSVPRRAGFS